VAHATGADFIRAEGFVFSHVADEGWIDACAGELLRYRRAIGANNIMAFTDVKKKHWLVFSNVQFAKLDCCYEELFITCCILWLMFCDLLNV